MRFRIDLKIFILLILFYFTRQIQTYAMIMFFAIIHELGHLIAGLVLGMRPEKIDLNPFGVSIAFKLRPEDYNKKIKKANQLEVKKIFVALAGPLTNAIIILITSNLNIDIFEELLIIYTNLLLIMFNLLPIYPLDGGRILKGFLYIKYGKVKAEKFINNVSFVTTMLITLVSSFAILFFENIAIFLGVVYLWGLTLKSDREFKMKQRVYEIIEEFNIK